MGNYLDINGNTRTRPNENYAREVLQLFSIGTVTAESRRHAAARRARASRFPTYTQDDGQQLRPRLHRLALRAGAARRRPELHRPDGGQRAAARRRREDAAERRRRCRPTRTPRRTWTPRIDNIFNDPERRAVHLEAADPASGDEQPEPGLRRRASRRSSTATAPARAAI